MGTWSVLSTVIAIFGFWIWDSEVARQRDLQLLRIEGVAESQKILLSHFLDDLDAASGSLSSDLAAVLAAPGAVPEAAVDSLLRRRHLFYPAWEAVGWTPADGTVGGWSRRGADGGLLEEAQAEGPVNDPGLAPPKTAGRLEAYDPVLAAPAGQAVAKIGWRVHRPVFVEGVCRGWLGLEALYPLEGSTVADLRLTLYNGENQRVWPLAETVSTPPERGEVGLEEPILVRSRWVPAVLGDRLERSAPRSEWQLEVSGAAISAAGRAHLEFLRLWLYGIGGSISLLLLVLVFLRERAQCLNRQVQDALERQSAYWSRMVNTLPIPVFFLEENDGPFVRMNDAMERFMGRPVEQLRGRSLSDLVPADTLDGSIDDTFIPREDGAETAELTLLNELGERRKATVVRASLTGADGEMAVVGAIIDHTDAFNAYEAMESYLDLMTKVTSQIPGVVYQFKMNPDETSCFPYASIGIRDIFEVMPLEVEHDASKVFLRVHPDDRAKVQASLIESRNRLTPWKSEYRVRRHDGTIRWLQGNSIPEREADGSVLWHGFVSDITESKEIETQLRVAKAEAERSDRAKGAFLAAMSHEIRTPMNGVIGMTSLLSKTKLTLDQASYVNTIRHSGDALLVVINDILDFSKIESGFLELDKTLFSVSDCVEGVVDILAPQAASKGLELACYIDPRVPAEMLGDMTRVRQVLVNLVGNAIKFTAQGEVFINLDLESTAKGVFLRISVEDTGPGIPEDRQQRLFKPFSQVDTSTSRIYGGTGLGLAISHRLSELMGASLTFESTVGEGSNFILTLPLDRVSSGSIGEQVAPWLAALEGMRVLVAEPNPMLREVLLSQLSNWAITAVGVRSPEDLEAVWKPQSFHACLLSHTFSSALSRPWRERLADSSTPVLEMTTLGCPASADWDSHLVKPVKAMLLCQWLASVSEKRHLRPSSPDHGAQGALVLEGRGSFSSRATHPTSENKPLRILVAEDNLVNQKVATLFLRRMGYVVDLVDNGKEAVAAVETKDYDLVLMDVQMPLMDGLEATREIRKLSGDTQQPWIVALTASAVQGDREKAIAHGMNDYLPKPLKFEDLQQAIQNVPTDAVGTT